MAERQSDKSAPPPSKHWQKAWESPKMIAGKNIQYRPLEGLILQSDDENFKLSLRSRVQLRWTLQQREAEWLQELTLKRARLSIKGHGFKKKVAIGIQFAFSPGDVGREDNIAPNDNSSSSPFLDYYVDFRLHRDFNIRVGQHKLALNREYAMSSGALQLVDRSLTHREFTLDRDTGLTIFSKDFLGIKRLRYLLGVSIGRGRDSIGFEKLSPVIYARAEVFLFGMFSDLEQSDFSQEQPRLSFGGAFAYLSHAPRDRGILGNIPTDGGSTDTQHLFADLTFKWRGFTALAEYARRQGERRPGEAGREEPPRNAQGFYSQFGYILPQFPLEFTARYGVIQGFSPSPITPQSEMLFGLSYYLLRHAIKVQGDYARYWTGTLSDGHHEMRLQLQVAL